MPKITDLDKKIKDLKKQISYEKRKMKVCAYGKSDIYYLMGLENELAELENKRDEI